MSSKTWLITGTSTGLGRLMTERLLARGDKVIATLRKSGALDDLQAQYNGRLHILLLDVTDTDAVLRTVQQAFDFAGRIDVLVSNAGYGLFGAAEEVSDAQIDRQIATNLIGPIQLIRAALPALRRQGGGRIVQISSEGGQIAWPNFSLYHATKWGIEGFIESVAQEVAPFGIDFMIAEPGPTATNFAGGLIRLRRWLVMTTRPPAKCVAVWRRELSLLTAMRQKPSLPSSMPRVGKRRRFAWRWAVRRTDLSTRR